MAVPHRHHVNTLDTSRDTPDHYRLDGDAAGIAEVDRVPCTDGDCFVQIMLVLKLAIDPVDGKASHLHQRTTMLAYHAVYYWDLCPGSCDVACNEICRLRVHVDDCIYY